MEWKDEVTLSSKQKEFKWRYSRYDGLTITRPFKNGIHKTQFTDTDIEKIINYIQENGKVTLSNNVKKLADGTEKDGIGSFIFQNISRNTTDAQTASHLASILYNVGVLGYNGALRGMEFWILEENWKEKLTV